MKRYKSNELGNDSRISGAFNGAPLAIARAKTNDLHALEQLHVHPNSFEFYIILSGTAELEVNNEVLTVGSGDVVLVEAGESHCMKAFTEETDYMTIRLADAEKQIV
jgi:mannose-6-phosphate isomerase-like protein (cupin superfamily)